MKIKFIGTGSIRADRFSACAFVDDKILIDAPNGAMKQMKRLGSNPENISIVLITHFHGDHYFDIPFLMLELGLTGQRSEHLTIVTPMGESNKLKQLFTMGYSVETWEKLVNNTNLEIIEIDDGESLQLHGYDIKAIEVEHDDDIKCLGYIVSKGEKTFGYTGDTRECSGVETILQNTPITVMDVSFVQKIPSHLSLAEAELLAEKYKGKCKIIATHMFDEIREQEVKNIKIVDDGDVVNI
ncbi:MAG TPA: ribonuclease Z [Clostridiales bacterium]|nr:MAG: hypothetical protein A2Y18_04270 [Clostridiales bacterium GWD2_32_19]HCC07308.1 ribonuclease Z [Clostridiales bacterium]